MQIHQRQRFNDAMFGGCPTESFRFTSVLPLYLRIIERLIREVAAQAAVRQCFSVVNELEMVKKRRACEFNSGQKQAQGQISLPLFSS